MHYIVVDKQHLTDPRPVFFFYVITVKGRAEASFSHIKELRLFLTEKKKTKSFSFFSPGVKINPAVFYSPKKQGDKIFPIGEYIGNKRYSESFGFAAWDVIFLSI